MNTINNLEAALSGARLLSEMTGKEGRFRYRYDAVTGKDSKGYNVLRHAGSIWSMLDVYALCREDKILSAARRAVTYLLNNHLQFFRDYNNTCICEDNKIKLGGNALAIIALTALYNHTQDKFLLNTSEQLAHFMVKEKGPDGEMVHKRYFRSGKISAFKSMYYTGEALLALLDLYQATNNRSWLNIVMDIETKLAAEDYGVKEQSHWMLYALASLSKVQPSDTYYLHAAKIARHILDHPDYLSWDRSTPIACRSEGLVAFVEMSQHMGSRDITLENRCLEQIASNLEKQKNYMHSYGDFVRGGHDHRKNEVRIDYIQHNISSLLHYEQLGGALSHR
jgi:hypothetical protein